MATGIVHNIFFDVLRGDHPGLLINDNFETPSRKVNKTLIMGSHSLAPGVDAHRPRRVRLRRLAAGRHVLRGATRRACAPPGQPHLGVAEH